MIDTLYKRAIGLARAGRKEEARVFFQHVLELNPKHEAAWMWYADTFTSLEEREDALEKCLRAIPSSGVALHGLKVLREAMPTEDLGDEVTGGQGNRQSSPLSRNSFSREEFNSPRRSASSIESYGVEENAPIDDEISSIFTVSPEQVTDEDLAKAERSLLNDPRRAVLNSGVDSDFYSEVSAPFGDFYTERPSGLQTNPSPTPIPPTIPAEPAPSRKTKQEEKASAVPAVQKAAPSWSPVFSDEANPRNNQSSDSSGRAVYGAEINSRDRSAYEVASEEPAQLVTSSSGTTSAKKPKKPGREQDVIFYLVVGVVIVLILLVVVLLAFVIT